MPYLRQSHIAEELSLRTLFVLLTIGAAQAAEPEAAPNPVQTALAACAAMQERFTGTKCTAASPKKGEYRVAIRAADPDAMRVVFMRSLDVADGLCGAGNKVELVQELMTAEGPRIVRWRVNPPDCGIERMAD